MPSSRVLSFLEVQVTAVERFWTKVNKRGSKQPHMKTRCWEWTASSQVMGYGQMSMPTGLRGAKRSTMVLAHRYSWTLHRAPVPEGMKVLHRCDNTKCVRPSHLFLGTQLDNMRDMRAKGRHVPGGFARRKLTDSQIAMIRQRAATGEPQVRIASDYQIDPSMVSLLVNGKRRKS